MKSIKKFSALLLVLAMVLAIVPLTASATVKTAEEQVLDKLKDAESEWWDGKLWTATEEQAWGSQCFGFMRALFFRVFGVRISSTMSGLASDKNLVCQGTLGNNYTESELKNLLGKAKPGDIFVAGPPTNKRHNNNHFVIIRSVNKVKGVVTSISVYDANGHWPIRDARGNAIPNGKGGYKADANNTIRVSVNWPVSAIKKDRNISAALYRYINYSDSTTIQEPVKEIQKAVIKEDIYTISPKCAPSHCLDVESSKKTNWAKDNSANVQLWTNDKTDNQQWKVVSVGDGYYKLVSQRSGRCLDVAGRKFDSGTNVQQYDYSAKHDSQKWMFEDAGDGYYYIISKGKTSLCLDVSGGNNTDGANVQVWTKNNTDAQKWKLVPVNCSHSWGSWKTTKEANCGVTGQKTHTCSICGETQSQNIAALKHNYTVTNSTATKDTYTCANCGHSYDKAKTVVATTPTPTPTPSTSTSTPEKKWSEWSGWSTTPAYESDTRKVKTRQVEVSPARTEYRYGRYMAYNGPKTQDTYWCTTYARNRGYASVSAAEYTSWSTSRVSPSGGDYTCGFCKGNHIGVDHYSPDGRPWWHTYKTSSGEYYWEETRTVAATYRTEYSYSDYK